MQSSNTTMATVKIKFPEELWIHDIFHKFYDVDMKILYFLPYDLENSIGNSIIEIQHWDIDLIIEEVKDHDSVREFTVIEKEEHRVKFNVKTQDPYLLYAVIKCGVLVNFPVKVEEGYAYWELISSRQRVDNLLTLFEEMGIKFDLLRIGNSPYVFKDEKEILSFEELEVLNKAIEEGFFDVPRKISLEDLANKLDKSKSTLSVMLRKIIKKKVVVQS